MMKYAIASSISIDVDTLDGIPFNENDGRMQFIRFLVTIIIRS